uniref:Peptidoglycan-recognition protein n=1 Tax=Antheraea pernyi TaxID=7119 RepID=A0A125S9Y3_ANTPE|nr:peptidoglycan recognition protein B [Antheraea pernyi]
MAKYFLLALTISLVGSVLPYPNPRSSDYIYPFPFVSKELWGGRPATGGTALNNPVTYVVIHHTYIPGVCMTREECSSAMRSMQNTHQLINGWADIGYNFAVGGEGSVYEGRGWTAVGAHAVGFNTNSIGIVLIGDWVSNLPPTRQLQTAKELIAAGVKLGYIRPDYMLIGHRQATPTECPGETLFREISTWDHFTSTV